MPKVSSGVRWRCRSIWWDLVNGPADAGHGGDAEFAVDVGAARVVDPGDDDRNAVGLPGGAGGDDVAVVTGGDGDECVGLLDPGGGQHGAVVAVAD